jgi:hypothetical protein
MAVFTHEPLLECFQIFPFILTRAAPRADGIINAYDRPKPFRSRRSDRVEQEDGAALPQIRQDQRHSGFLRRKPCQECIYYVTCSRDGGIVARRHQSTRIAHLLIRIGRYEEIARHRPSFCAPAGKEKSPDRKGPAEAQVHMIVGVWNHPHHPIQLWQVYRGSRAAAQLQRPAHRHREGIVGVDDVTRMPQSLSRLAKGEGVGARKNVEKEGHDTAHPDYSAHAVEDERRQYLFAVQHASVCSRVVRSGQREPRKTCLVVRCVRLSFRNDSLLPDCRVSRYD